MRDGTTANTETKKLIYDEPASTQIIISPNVKKANSLTYECRCNNLSVDVEGLKLDQVVDERNILINTSPIKVFMQRNFTY